MDHLFEAAKGISRSKYMQRPDFDPRLVKERGLTSLPSGVRGTPRCKSFVPGAQHGSHFRLIVGTDGTSGVATPKLLAARLPRLCRPRKCLQTLPLQSWRPDFVGRKMRRKRGEEEEGRGERERRGRGNAKT